jgi:hypothetical protein
LRTPKVLTEYYNNIADYLTESFGANFIFLTILLSTTTAIAYFIVISYIITKMDKRHFIRKQNVAEDTITFPHLILMNSNVANVIKIAKVIVGVCLLLIGLVMLVLPGQGLITMLIGFSLLPFPGKDKMEQIILSRKSVRSSLNWIRMKAKKDPFIFD